VAERSFTDAEVDAAVEALSDPERFRAADAYLARKAPQLQRILNEALLAGGFFDQAHQSELRSALAVEDPAERETRIATLLAEETRVGMMIGVALGWGLHEELGENRDG
jgi:hypothetical protein